MTDPRIQWLREQVQGRLATAKAAAGPHWFLGSSEDDDDRAIWYTAPSTLHAGALADYCVADRVDEADAAHIAANDPADVIAQCEAELGILDAYEAAAAKYDSKVTMHDLAEDRWQAGEVFGLKEATEAVASAYKHSPGYAAHWGETAAR